MGKEIRYEKVEADEWTLFHRVRVKFDGTWIRRNGSGRECFVPWKASTVNQAVAHRRPRRKHSTLCFGSTVNQVAVHLGRPSCAGRRRFVGTVNQTVVHHGIQEGRNSVVSEVP